jgi:hypothetical protein
LKTTFFSSKSKSHPKQSGRRSACGRLNEVEANDGDILREVTQSAGEKRPLPTGSSPLRWRKTLIIKAFDQSFPAAQSLLFSWWNESHHKKRR